MKKSTKEELQELVIKKKKESEFYKSRDEETQMRILFDIKENFKIIKDLEHLTPYNDCPKCGCNRNDQDANFSDFVIQCCSCKRGIEAYPEEYSVLLWQNNLF